MYNTSKRQHMKKLIFSTLLAPILLFSSTLTLEISNIEKQLVIGLYDKAEVFPTVSKALRKQTIEVKGTTLVATFDNIADGMYALAIYHDENSNQVLDKNFFGIPREGYAFSNNFKPMFSKPKFIDAQFELKKHMTLRIKMNY